MNLYLVRHGETCLNKKGVYYGWTDISLSAKGAEQASMVKKSLQDIALDLIIASPFKRTLETAEIINAEGQCPLIIEEDLKELNFGLWEGKHYKDLEEEYPEEWRAWINNWDTARPPQGENFEDLTQRVEKFLDKLLAIKERNILLIAHQGSLRIILSKLLKLGQDGFWNFHFEQGAYSMVEIEGEHCTIKKINCL